MRSLRAMGLVLSLCVAPMLVVGSADAQSANASKTAVQRFADAQALYESGEYDKAYAQFQTLVQETGSPNAELYLGRCLRELGRLPEAYEATARALENALAKAEKEEKYQQTRSAAAADLAKLELRVGKIIVAVADAPENLVITVNGQTLPRAKYGIPAAVNIGEAVVVLEAPEKKRIERRTMVAGGKTETVTVVLEPLDANMPPPPQKVEPPPSTGGPARVVGFVVAGVGVAGMATFAVAGLMANQRYDEIYAACGGTHCTDTKYVTEIENGRQLDLVANIGLGVGIGGIAVGTLLIALGGPKPASTPTVSGFWLPGAGGFSVSGRF